MANDRTEQDWGPMAEKAKSTFWGYIGAELIEWEPGRAVARLTIYPQHLNLIGILHGGVHATLLDSVMGLAAMSARPQADAVTSNLSIQFTAPARLEQVEATGEVVHQSSRTLTTQGTLRREDGSLCAMATASFRIVERLGGASPGL